MRLKAYNDEVLECSDIDQGYEYAEVYVEVPQEESVPINSLILRGDSAVST